MVLDDTKAIERLRDITLKYDKDLIYRMANNSVN